MMRTFPPRDLGTLLDVRRARLVVIHDFWNGYSPDAPMSKVADLRRTPKGGLRGTAWRASGGSASSEREADVPPIAARRFLAAAASARLAPGPVEPEMLVTDDYPHIEVMLHVAPEGHTDGGFALLHTRSPADLRVPWNVLIDGETYAVRGDSLARAYKALVQSIWPRARTRARTTPKKASFTREQRKFMLETYGRILTPEEWEERQKRFASGPDDITYGPDGILKL